MSQLGVLPCGNKKIWEKYPELGTVQARDAYIGTLHHLCRRYAETFIKEWVILSAKHGFLFADDTVDGPYDVAFHQKGNNVISTYRLRDQVTTKRLNQYDELIVLTGKKYKKVIEASFGDDFPAIYPLLSYKGIGYMQQALKNAVQTGKALH